MKMKHAIPMLLATGFGNTASGAGKANVWNGNFRDDDKGFDRNRGGIAPRTGCTSSPTAT